MKLTKNQIEKIKEICKNSDSIKKAFIEIFPELDFRENAFLDNIKYNDNYFEKINRDFFGGQYVIDLLNGATPPERSDLQLRALFISKRFEIETQKIDDGTIIKIFKK